MVRRSLLFLSVMGLVTSSAGFASAQEEPPPQEIPEVVQIEDPAGDANYMGDDQTTPADLTISDLLKVWFTHDETTISVHIQTEGPPPSGNASYVFRVNTNPGDVEEGCLEWEAIIEGPTYVGETFGRITDECAETDPVDGEVTIVEAADGTGITTITVPRTANELLADGSVLTSPWALALNNTGGPSRLVGPTVDDTKIGTDYTIAADEEPKKKKKKKKKKKAKPPQTPTVLLSGGSHRPL